MPELRSIAFAALCALVVGGWLGCRDDDDDDTSAGDDDSATGDDDTADDDTVADVDVTDPCDEEPLDAAFDDSCVPSTGTNDRVLIRATALFPRTALADAEVVFSTSSGEILCVDQDCGSVDGYAEATILCGDVVLPAFVDPHNHMQYNVLGPWPHGRSWENRYEWRGDGDYWDYTDLVDLVSTCDAMRWAELRAIMTGSSAVAGNSMDDCAAILVRNLDEGQTYHYLAGYDPEVRTNDPETDYEDLEEWAEELDDGHISAYIPHCAEGLYGTVRSEFQPLIDAGLLRSETALVHGTDLDPAQLTLMGLNGTHLIWSPQTNIDLYGRTADVTTAQSLGVPIALGPDWTLSGTAGQLFELQCADRLNRESYHGAFCLSDLVAMATEGAAGAVGLGGVLGELAPGARADLLLLSGERSTPWTTVLTADQTQVELVTVDGIPLYGDADLMATFPEAQPFPGELCEVLDVCGASKTICHRATDAEPTYAELHGDLQADLGDQLYPTFFCPDDPDYRPQWCEPRVSGDAGAADADADGIDDAGDLCPHVFDPEQRDEDGDGVGNACDPRVWEPGTEGDSQVTAEDLDGDGTPNDADPCPWLHDEASADADGDGLPDACDPCPDDAETSCTTVPILRDWRHPLHPYEWDWVTLDELVVTGIDEETNFYAQDPALADWGGLFTYDMLGSDGVTAGSRVQVEGLYQEYYGQTEVCFGSVLGIEADQAPQPVAIEEVCDIGAFGPLQHAMEGMLVSVESADGFEVTAVDHEYNEFQLEGCLWVDDDLYSGLTLPDPIDEVVVRAAGVLRYSHSVPRIAPRDGSDVEYDE